MTYRSRSGGPQSGHKKRPRNPDQPRKLHHPPAASSSAAVPRAESSSHPALSDPSDELVLSTLRSALSETLSSPDLRATIQRIKGLLYDAKWLEVFTDAALLEAYAGRWVPSRALCFRELMLHLEEVRGMMLGGNANDGQEGSDDEGDEEDGDRSEEEEEEVDTPPLKVVSLGGGAGSELLAVASIVAYSQKRKGKGREVEWIGADIGSWSSVSTKIETSALSTLDVTLSTRYIEGDLLLPTPAILEYLPHPSSSTSTPMLITLLFTLTELLTQSPSGTIQLIRAITDRLPSGSLFLIADSASDIASFSLGSERKWPTYTIVDLVFGKMLPKGEEGEEGWDLEEGEDSRWFRLEQGVGADWPVKLENTRYWYRLYRKT